MISNNMNFNAFTTCEMGTNPQALNDKVSYHADNAGGAHGKDTNDK